MARNTYVAVRRRTCLSRRRIWTVVVAVASMANNRSQYWRGECAANAALKQEQRVDSLASNSSEIVGREYQIRVRGLSKR